MMDRGSFLRSVLAGLGVGAGACAGVKSEPEIDSKARKNISVDTWPGRMGEAWSHDGIVFSRYVLPPDSQPIFERISDRQRDQRILIPVCNWNGEDEKYIKAALSEYERMLGRKGRMEILGVVTDALHTRTVPEIGPDTGISDAKPTHCTIVNIDGYPHKGVRFSSCEIIPIIDFYKDIPVIDK